MTDLFASFATTIAPDEGTALQCDLAAHVRDAVIDWMEAWAPHLLQEPHEPEWDAVRQRQDIEREIAACERSFARAGE